MASLQAEQPQQRRRSTRQAAMSSPTTSSSHEDGHEQVKRKKKTTKTKKNNSSGNSRIKETVIGDSCTCQHQGLFSHSSNDGSHSHERAPYPAASHRMSIDNVKAHSVDGATSRVIDHSSSKGKGREVSSSHIQSDNHSLCDGSPANGRIAQGFQSATSHGDSTTSERGRKRLLSSNHSEQPELSSFPSLARPAYSASASSLPWAIGANADALPQALAFNFAGTKNSNTGNNHSSNSIATSPRPRTIARSINGNLLPPKEEALAIAPFLFDTSDGDELHPVGSTIRRSSSLSPPSNASNVIDDSRAGHSHLDDWVKHTAPLPPTSFTQEPASYTSSSTATTSSNSSSANSSGSSYDNARSSNGSGHSTACSTSPPTSNDSFSSTPSPKDQSSSSATTTSLPNTNTTSHKRSSPLMVLDPIRLKKRKLSHRIRSFLLLRPPGFPLPGTDGAADIMHITRAPAWLKNATSELSRESRMAPHEHYWSGYEADADNWCVTLLEKEFARLMMRNMRRDGLEVDEREGLSEESTALWDNSARQLQRSPEQIDDANMNTTDIAGDSSLAGRVDVDIDIDIDTAANAKAASIVIPNRTRHKRTRLVSAPPTMEADPHKIANALVSPPPHDLPSKTPLEGESHSTSHPLTSATASAITQEIPPEVLKAQLLAVLRSRLPEGAKNSDAPLRMKKFVVWNAWMRRSTIPRNRPRYRRRSTSAEGSEPAERDDGKRSSSTVHVIIPDTVQEESSLKDDHVQPDDKEEEGHFDPYGMTSIPEEQSYELSPYLTSEHVDEQDTSQDLTTLSSALGLVLHDETGSTGRRFSRAFAEDEDDPTDEEDSRGDTMVAGPFVGSRSRLLHTNQHDAENTMSDTAPLVLSPLPIHPSNPSHYSRSANSTFTALEGEYAGSSPPSHTSKHSLHEILGGERTVSPIRALMEQKASTATPPSFSANLIDDEMDSAPSRVVGDDSEQTIIPFWFDQESVAFDSSDDYENEDEDIHRWNNGVEAQTKGSAGGPPYSAEATPTETFTTISSAESKAMASQSTSRGSEAPRDTWSVHGPRGVAA